MSLTSLENRIVSEWNWFRSLVALHPYITIGAVAVAGWATGRLHFPI